MLIKFLYNIKNLKFLNHDISIEIFPADILEESTRHTDSTRWHNILWSPGEGCYLRPVRGCTMGCCVTALVFTICLGLLTLVLDLANSNLMVCGRSGSNLTPCCNKTSQTRTSTIITRGRGLVRSACDNFMINFGISVLAIIDQQNVVTCMNNDKISSGRYDSSSW